jgi:hypothetical protein
MRPLSPAELLDVREAGEGRPMAERALLLLAAASPERARDDLAALSIGERDRRLLTLREWTFGPEVSAVAECPACAERLEIGFQTSEIQSPLRPEPEALLGGRFEAEGYTVEFRLPDSADLLAVTEEGVESPEEVRQLLLERCVRADNGDKPVPASTLPETVIGTVEERMAAIDPAANTELALTCPRCGHAWHAPFDIVSFLWNELEARADRLLLEVHWLASAYGWSERDVLALGTYRRQRYVEMVQL